MRHRVAVRKLSKTPAHRKAMLKNMLCALYTHERIKSTHAKCRVLKRMAEKLVTRAKTDTLHNRRMIRKWVPDKEILNKLFTEIAPRYAQTPGGYTRITKIGPRYGDAAAMVYLSFVRDDEPVSATSASKKKGKDVRKPKVKGDNVQNTKDEKKASAATSHEAKSADTEHAVKDKNVHKTLESLPVSKVKASKDSSALASLNTQKSRKTIPKK